MFQNFILFYFILFQNGLYFFFEEGNKANYYYFKQFHILKSSYGHGHVYH